MDKKFSKVFMALSCAICFPLCSAVFLREGTKPLDQLKQQKVFVVDDYPKNFIP